MRKLRTSQRQVNRVAGLVGLATCVALAVTPAAAQSDAPFGGKNIEIWIGSSAGGGYDINARTVGRYLPDHIAGKPTIIPKNLPGSGSVRATSAVYSTAPKDGTVIGAPSRAVITMPLIGVENAKFEPAKMNWVGSVSSEDGTCVSWHTTPIKTLADAQKNKVIIGTSGPGTSSYTYALMIQNLFDAKFEIIRGFPDNTNARLAMERGEVDGTCGSMGSLKNMKSDWLREKKVNYLVLLSTNPDPDLPDLKPVTEVATGEQRDLLKVVLTPLAAGRPLFLPPGVPMDRVTILRRAFDATVKDPRFVDEAKKIGIEINPMTGEQIQQMVADVYALPPTIVEKAKIYLDSN